MTPETERRKEKRTECKAWFQIYSSKSIAPYTVDVENLSPNGAFAKAKYIPEKDEVINFTAMNEYYQPIYSSLAKVQWTEEIYKEIRPLSQDMNNFGIEFSEPIPEEIFRKITTSKKIVN